MVEENVTIDLNEKQLTLIEMMYHGDIDASKAEEALGINTEELYNIVDELKQMKMMRAVGDGEVELTENAINYLKEKRKN